MQDGISEARRQELLEFGFPDDGYDYLKHCRVIGRGSASLQHNTQPAAATAAPPPVALRDPAAASSSSAAAAAEPQQPSQSVYLQAPRVRAPTADVKLVDARRIAVAAAAAPSSSTADTAQPTAVTAAAVLPVGPASSAPAAAKQIGGRELAAELLELEQLMTAAEEASDTEAAGKRPQ